MIQYPINNHLRRMLRQKRFSVSKSKQQKASLLIAQTIVRLSEFRASKRIACYLAQEGEIDVWPIMQRAWETNKKIYLPAIHPLKERKMDFYEYEANDPLIEDRWHIQEPEKNSEKLIHPWTLDLVLMPLVGFDETGHRLGRGGGYYDKTFAFIKTSKNIPFRHEHSGLHDDPCSQQRRNSKGEVYKHCPFLIGIAYEFQKVGSIQSNEWDINPDLIVTENRVYKHPASHQ